MKISGFSYARNADSLYYPVKESILSVLPICDEFVIAVGKSSGGDRTRQIIESIGDPKIRIIDTVWDLENNATDHIFRQQANLALARCTGDWCFHIQCDEVVHENDLPEIERRCRDLVDDRRVEGMLFKWYNFWGDYEHHLVNHRWSIREIRIIRNGIGVESYKDSQSFRRNGRKLRVIALDAHIYHYSYVRPPRLLRKKQAVAHAIYRHRTPDPPSTDALEPWDYGSLEKIPRFTGTHPAVMSERIAAMDWANELQYSGASLVHHKHDRLKYRILTFIEQRILGGRYRFGSKNYRLLRR